MTPATAETFFTGLAKRAHEPVLHAASGMLRFDLRDGDKVQRWFVAVDRGTVSVTRSHARADCIVVTDRRLFDRIVSGQANAMAALLRGLIGFEGDPQLLLLFQRLFPGPEQGDTEAEEPRAAR